MAEPSPVDPRVFVVGCPRSGTTLLQRILDAHSDLAVANDTHFVTRSVEKLGLAPQALAGESIPLTDEVLAALRGYHRFPRLGLEEAAIERATARASTYASLVGALYEELAIAKGKRFGGEKTPDFVRRLPLLHALFPDTRTVHIIRDGRDVILSLLQWATPTKGPGRLATWADEPLGTAALWWEWQVRSGREARGRVGENRCMELRYEALASEPEPEAHRLCAFLGLDYDPKMLAFHEGRRRDDPTLDAKKAWLPPTPGLRNWREQMDEDGLPLVETLIGPFLEELGYERSVDAVTADIAERAAACRESFAQALEERGQPKPEETR
jgi:hypothetical protein